MQGSHPLRGEDPRRIGAYDLVGRFDSGGVRHVGRGADGPVTVQLLSERLTAHTPFLRHLHRAMVVADASVIRILDAGLHDDRPYLVSESVDGPLLKAYVRAHGPLSGGDLDRSADATLRALAAIHRAGISHGSLDPGSVVMGPEGPRVAGFGVAEALDRAQGEQRPRFDGPAYIAPELLRGEPGDSRADVFAWACTMTYAATGRPPFGDTEGGGVAGHVVADRILTAEPDLGTLSGGLREAVIACLARDPGARPTASQARRILRGGPGSAPRVPEVVRPPVPPQPAPRSRSRLKLVGLAALAMAVALVGGVVGYRLLGQQDPGCRDYDRSYTVQSNRSYTTGSDDAGTAAVSGTVDLKITVCADRVSGSIALRDSAPGDGWSACADIPGHIAGTDDGNAGRYEGTGKFASEDSGDGASTHDFDVRVPQKETFDFVYVNLANCRGEEWAYQSSDRLQAGAEEGRS